MKFLEWADLVALSLLAMCHQFNKVYQRQASWNQSGTLDIWFVVAP